MSNNLDPFHDSRVRISWEGRGAIDYVPFRNMIFTVRTKNKQNLYSESQKKTIISTNTWRKLA